MLNFDLFLEFRNHGGHILAFFTLPWQYTPVASGWIGCNFVFTYSSQFGLIFELILHFFDFFDFLVIFH